MFIGRWLNNFVPKKYAPFRNKVKLAVEKCKFLLYIVLIP
jgi:hypothetical protein